MTSNVSKRDTQTLHFAVRSGLAGGIAGCVAKTVVAPLDRVKILFQASNPDFQKYTGSWSGIFRAANEIYQDGGVRGLLQGHSATLLRVFPYAAIKFMTYDQIHYALMPTREQETSLRRFTAGALSGVTSVFCVYPLDIIRIRMAFHTKSTDKQNIRPSFLRAARQIYSESAAVPSTQSLLYRYPVLKYYRGFIVTVAGMIPWEAVPFARPAPKRPPPSASPSTDQLLARIAVLEEKLANIQHAPKSSSEGTEEEAESSNLLNPLGFWGSSESESFLVSAVLAQDSLLGHHGEYIGRDSAIRSLHMLSSPQEIPFHYTKSTDAISLYKHPTGELMPPPLPSTLEYLVPNIPPRPVVDMLCQTFFAKANWRYGIPEEWFYTAYDQMWTVLSLPQGCGIQVNPHWLSLLFAICAITPKSVKEMSHLDDKNNLRGEAFFSSAMVARRIAEDTYLSSPVFAPLESAADGTVLSCFAAPILAYFLAERNRVSEAWKLIGNSIRSAQSVGLHRDPGWGQWHTMSENERLLRSRAWWALYQWDLLYSFTLSRPSMLQVTCFDVPLPCANPQAPVKAQLFSDLQSQFVQLARILDKAIHKVCQQHIKQPLIYLTVAGSVLV
ncbi:hypothetical protein ONZ45_g17513 [Pleurotus djamor]|nr:hypothetical protein ONZ45_g17513 [Pleurotus djamor]